MKTLNCEMNIDILNDYALTSEEMICVKGGYEGEPIIVPNPPPVKI